jgi:hypothetical protein
MWGFRLGVVEGDDIFVEGLAGYFESWVSSQNGRVDCVKGDREEDGVVGELGENHLVLRSGNQDRFGQPRSHRKITATWKGAARVLI